MSISKSMGIECANDFGARHSTLGHSLSLESRATAPDMLTIPPHVWGDLTLRFPSPARNNIHQAIRSATSSIKIGSRTGGQLEIGLDDKVAWMGYGRQLESRPVATHFIA
jgi:hypothetical protein